MVSNNRFITIEGAIGVGKTSLARRLSEHFSSQLILEQPQDNPFLEPFYKKPNESALAAQLFFLMQRFEQLSVHRHRGQGNLIADFLMGKDKLFAQITLSEQEFLLYQRIYQQIKVEVLTPDLVIYLQAPVSTLKARISKRGIAVEQAMPKDYLHRVSEAYMQYFLSYDDAPLLIVNATQIDPVRNDEDFAALVNVINKPRKGRHYFNPLAATK